MRIGSGWTKTTENGDTYISISLDSILGVIFPFLKPLLEKCYLTLWHISQADRKGENFPSWDFVLSVKKEKEVENLHSISQINNEKISN